MNPVASKKDLFDRILSNKDRILCLGVSRLGIFGSFVRNQVNEQSDVDFFIHFIPQQKTFKNFMQLAEVLEEITGRRIELVTPQSLSKHIGPHILNEVEYVPLAA
jgi:uncharacterized protein